MGTTPEQVKSLERLAAKCGFALIEGVSGADIPTLRTLIAFILVHYQSGDHVLDGVIRTIRGGSHEVRFSPIIVISDDCDFETVLRYVHLGVDDVISLPENRDILIRRFASQLSAEHLYIETSSYFGPDRRRLDVDPDDVRRVGMAGHARYHFRRLPDVGIVIVRHEIHPGPHFQPKVHFAA